MALCHITGTVYLPSGEVAANRIVEFYKISQSEVTADYLGAVTPEVVKVRLDAAGQIDAHLITANYYGDIFDRNGKNSYRFKATVPEQASALFSDIIEAADPVEPLPAWLQQAWDARDEAQAAEVGAEDAADRAEAAAVSSESARDSALAAGAWTYSVLDNAALFALSGMSAGDTAIVSTTLHVWTYSGSAWIDGGESVIAGKLDGGTVVTDATGTAFVDGLGGEYGIVTPTNAVFMGLSGSVDGTGRIGDVVIESAANGRGEALADSTGGSWADIDGGTVRIGNQIMTETAVLLSSGRMVDAEPAAVWVGPGANDTHISDIVPVAAARPVISVPGYTPPVITSDRYYKAGYDLAVFDAVMIPTFAAFPSGRIIRCSYGAVGVVPGQSGEGADSYIRISVNDGANWRHVFYIVPPAPNQDCADCFVRRLPDGRALFVWPHNDGTKLNALGVVLANPEDDPDNWAWGEMYLLGVGFPSLPTRLDNGDLVGTVANPRLGLSESGNVFGYYTISSDGEVIFTDVSVIPNVAPGATTNSFAETAIAQIGSNEIFAMFRTTTIYHYTTSSDRGQTWSTPAPFTTFGTQSTKVFMDRLPDGRLLAMSNVTPSNRRDQTMFISDVGASPLDPWPMSMLIDSRSWTSYPNADWVPDARGRWRGQIVFGFDHGRNTVSDLQGGYFNELLDGETNLHAMRLGMKFFDLREISR